MRAPGARGRRHILTLHRPILASEEACPPMNHRVHRRLASLVKTGRPKCMDAISPPVAAPPLELSTLGIVSSTW
jgi:hypothetical protein